jgi:hypothetical protein
MQFGVDYKDLRYEQAGVAANLFYVVSPNFPSTNNSTFLNYGSSIGTEIEMRSLGLTPRIAGASGNV